MDQQPFMGEIALWPSSVIIPTGFTQDTWVEQVQAAPTDYSVVHHIAAHARAFGEVLLVSGATIICAEVMTSAPTYAAVENFQMPRIWRSSLAVRMS